QAVGACVLRRERRVALVDDVRLGRQPDAIGREVVVGDRWRRRRDLLRPGSAPRHHRETDGEADSGDPAHPNRRRWQIGISDSSSTCNIDVICSGYRSAVPVVPLLALTLALTSTAAQASADLHAVTRIYVEAFAPKEGAGELRSALIGRLKKLHGI